MSYFIHQSYQDCSSFVIYDASLVEKPRKRPRRFLAPFSQGAGLALLGLSFFFLLSFFGPILWAEIGYQLKKSQVFPQTSKSHSAFGELLWLDEQGIISPASWEFALIIPKIKLNAKVIPEIDASSEKDYRQALKQGVAHAKGSSLPDQDGLIYIFGHSTDFVWNVTYDALFYLLGKLEEEDQVSLFYQGRHYDYQVVQKEIVKADDLSFLNNLDQKKLILQTCWPPGTTWKRLIVVARPKEDLKKLTDL